MTRINIATRLHALRVLKSRKPVWLLHSQSLACSLQYIIVQVDRVPATSQTRTRARGRVKQGRNPLGEPVGK